MTRDWSYYEARRPDLLVGPLPHRKVGYLWAPDCRHPGVRDRMAVEMMHSIGWPVGPKED